MANQENIDKHKFEKGVSGNPAGRPPGIPNSKTILQRFLALTEQIENPVTGVTEAMSQLEIIYLKQIAKARKGDIQAMKEILDRYEGKATQTIDANITAYNKQDAIDEAAKIIEKEKKDAGTTKAEKKTAPQVQP